MTPREHNILPGQGQGLGGEVAEGNDKYLQIETHDLSSGAVLMAPGHTLA